MRLAEVAGAAMDDSTDLPEFVGITKVAFETYLQSWLLWVGTGRKFLPQPGGLNDQNEVEMQVILELDSLYTKVLSQARQEQEDATKIRDGQ